MSEQIFYARETIYWYNQQPALVPYHDCYSPKECKTLLEERRLPGSNRDLDPSDALHLHLLKILESLFRTYESTPLSSKSRSVFQRERVEELCNHAVQTRSSTSNYRAKLPQVAFVTRIYSGRIEMQFKDTKKSFSLHIDYERLGNDDNAYQYHYELRLDDNSDGI